MIYIKYSIEIVPYTVHQLAEIYKVKPRTLNIWLDKFRRELGKPQGHYYLIPQVRLIFEKLDIPGHLMSDALEQKTALPTNVLNTDNLDKAA